ncbi:unnamed protein product, partial [Protopolystoma xenopodis]
MPAKPDPVDDETRWTVCNLLGGKECAHASDSIHVGDGVPSATIQSECRLAGGFGESEATLRLGGGLGQAEEALMNEKFSAVQQHVTPQLLNLNQQAIKNCQSSASEFRTLKLPCLGWFCRLGDLLELHVDARLVSAAGRDIQESIRSTTSPVRRSATAQSLSSARSNQPSLATGSEVSVSGRSSRSRSHKLGIESVDMAAHEVSASKRLRTEKSDRQTRSHKLKKAHLLRRDLSSSPDVASDNSVDLDISVRCRSNRKCAESVSLNQDLLNVIASLDHAETPQAPVSPLVSSPIRPADLHKGRRNCTPITDLDSKRRHSPREQSEPNAFSDKNDLLIDAKVSSNAEPMGTFGSG